MTPRKTKGTTFRVAQAYFPAKVIFGTRFRCSVLSIRGPNSTSNPGMTIKTDSSA